jgi:hypothetical protein
MYLFSLLLFLAVATPAALQAQSKIYFKYDGSGNRKLRTIDMTKSATITAQDEGALDSRLGDQEIRIYPNPTKGLLKIDMPEMVSSKVTIQIFDSRGNLLISKVARETENQLDLSGYPGGLYILLIRTPDDRQEWKIIKE